MIRQCDKMSHHTVARLDVAKAHDCPPFHPQAGSYYCCRRVIADVTQLFTANGLSRWAFWRLPDQLRRHAAGDVCHENTFLRQEVD